ncbi:MAG: preprotein translocase subunit SecA [Chlorobi bacterium OLB7]|nr:MAG: preprotein translocase subunit SecA [Chlorobi bacterium OLB7]
MTQQEWLEHLRDGSGPLAPDAIANITPNPDLLQVVQRLIQSPWPDDPEMPPQEALLPIAAAFTIGLTGDTVAPKLLTSALRRAYIEDWDWMVEATATGLKHIGLAAFPVIHDEMLANERGTDREEPPPSYYQRLVEVLGAHAENRPDVAAIIMAMLRQRLADPLFSNQRLELWLASLMPLQHPDFPETIRQFFERMPPEYTSELIGTLPQALELHDRWSAVNNHRENILSHYQYLRDRIDEENNPQPADLSAAEPEKPAPSMRAKGPRTVIRAEAKIGRNDLCPCGSGKKYKKCHGMS